MKIHFNISCVTSVFFLLVTAGFLLPSSAQAATLQKPPVNLGLVGYWSFDEGFGNLAHDFSGNGNNGVLSGPTMPAWADGKHGNALDFNGEDNYVRFLPVAVGSNFTLSVAVNRKGATNSYTPIIEQGGTNSFRLIRYQNRFCLGNDSVTDNFYCTANIFSALNFWYSIIAFNNGTNHIYINGIEYPLTQATGSYSSWGTNQLNVGYRPYTASVSSFNGTIDDVRIYNRALSAAEIQNLYNAGTVKYSIPNKQGLVGYWSMDEGSGNTVRDYSGNNNNGYPDSTTMPGWVNGKHGKALNFASQNISGSVKYGDRYTVSAWIKPSLLDPMEGYGRTIIASSFSATDYYPIWILVENSKIRAYAYSASTANFANSNYNNIKAGQWYFITVSAARNGEAKIYINGQLDRTFAAGNQAANNFFTIGDLRPGRGLTFAGAVDDVRIHNRILSDSEIQGLYRSGEVKINSSQNNRLADGLVGLWSFNGPDISGTTALDRSGSGSNGTIYGGAKTTIGKVGQGLNFSGNAYINAPSFASLSDLSISLWIKAISKTHMWSTMVSSQSFRFSISATDKIAMSWTDGTSSEHFYSNAGSFTLDSWQFVTITKSGPVLTFYINGLPKGSGNITKSRTISTIEIGRDSLSGAGAADYITALLDEVRIYNRALSADEIKQLYNMGE